MTNLKNTVGRRNLSEEVADTVRVMILDGRLMPGSRINEVHLSEEMGISRTPLRESLSSLVSEGALEIIPRRGFFVRELTAAEAQHIYPIRALLDPEALKLQGLPSSAQLDAAKKINKKLLSAKSVKTAIELDDAWHLELYRHCPNPELVDLIKTYMRKTRRYELASMGVKVVVKGSHGSKAEMLKLLAAGNLADTCKRLRKSLLLGVGPVLRWLAERDQQESEQCWLHL